MGTLEIMALIVLAISVIKLVVIFVNPKSWMKVVEFVYKKPILTIILGFILAAVVLNKLLAAGITITEIFAVMLFFMLLMMAGFAMYRGVVLNMARNLFKRKDILKRAWFYVLVWIALIVWAIKEIFF